MFDLEKCILTSMKEHDDVKKAVFKAIKAEKQKFLTAEHAGTYDDAAEIAIIRKLVKQRDEAIEQYSKANRYDLVESEKAEMDVLMAMLPVPATREEIETAVLNWTQDNLVTTMPAAIPKHLMGTVIKHIKEIVPNAEGKLVAEVVKSHLV